MALAHGTAIAVALALIASAEPAQASQSPSAAATQPKEPITGLPLPLLDGERLAPLKGGCHIVLGPNASAELIASQSRFSWLGACRFGLADGPGFFAHAGDKPSRSNLRYGRYSRQPDDLEIFRKGPQRSVEWTFHIFDTPEAARSWSDGLRSVPSASSDLSWSAEVAYVKRAGSTEAPDEALMIWIDHKPCLRGGGGKSIAQSFVEILNMSPANANRVAPFCQAALARLQRERPDLISDYEWEPYRMLDWGYYDQMRIMRFKGASVETGKPDQEEIVVCPSPGESSSCKQVWAPVIAPYLQIRNAERKREAELDARRQQMIDALEAAFAEKLRERSLKAASRSPK